MINSCDDKSVSIETNDKDKGEHVTEKNKLKVHENETNRTETLQYYISANNK